MAAAPAATGEAVASAEIEPARRERQPGRSLLSPAQQVRVLNAIDSNRGRQRTQDRTGPLEGQGRTDDGPLEPRPKWRGCLGHHRASRPVERAGAGAKAMTMSKRIPLAPRHHLGRRSRRGFGAAIWRKVRVQQPELFEHHRTGRPRLSLWPVSAQGRAATKAYIDVRTRAASGARGDAGP